MGPACQAEWRHADGAADMGRTESGTGRQRGSQDSMSSAGTNTHSQRSSFAMERASLDANRSSLELFASLQTQSFVPVESNQNLEEMCSQMGIPQQMCDK